MVISPLQGKWKGKGFGVREEPGYGMMRFGLDALEFGIFLVARDIFWSCSRRDTASRPSGPL